MCVNPTVFSCNCYLKNKCNVSKCISISEPWHEMTRFRGRYIDTSYNLLCAWRCILDQKIDYSYISSILILPLLLSAQSFKYLILLKRSQNWYLKGLKTKVAKKRPYFSIFNLPLFDVLGLQARFYLGYENCGWRPEMCFY